MSLAFRLWQVLAHFFQHIVLLAELACHHLLVRSRDTGKAQEERVFIAVAKYGQCVHHIEQQLIGRLERGENSRVIGVERQEPIGDAREEGERLEFCKSAHEHIGARKLNVVELLDFLL